MRHLLAFALVVAPWIAVGCGGSENPDGDNPFIDGDRPFDGDQAVDGDAADGDTGTVTGENTIPVNLPAGGEVTDTLTGHTFLFPQGGQGDLTVTTLAELSPAPPWPGGTPFDVVFTGPQPVQLKLERPPGTNAWLFALADYGIDDPLPGTWPMWTTMPWEEGPDGFVRIPLPGSASAGRLAVRVFEKSGSKPRGYVAALPAVDPRQTAIETAARTYVTQALDRVPEGMKGTLEARIRQYPLRLAFVPEDGGDSYYRGVYNLVLDLLVSPVITYNIGVSGNPQRIAHEVGHYLTHMLMTDDAFYDLPNAPTWDPEDPESTHGFDTYLRPRLTLIEDYAFYWEWVLGTGFDPLTSLHPGRVNHPEQRDAPSVEGFGHFLFGALTATSETGIRDIVNERPKTPALGWPAGQVFWLYQQGFGTINEFYPALDAMVGQAGRPGALAVIAERKGWSYHGSGPLELDPALAGSLGAARVRAVTTVNGTEYEAQGGTVTGDPAAGYTYTVNRIFPGRSVVRVTISGLTREAEVDIPYTGETQEARTLPRLEFVTKTVEGRAAHVFSIPYNDLMGQASGMAGSDCDLLDATLEVSARYRVGGSAGDPEGAWQVGGTLLIPWNYSAWSIDIDEPTTMAAALNRTCVHPSGNQLRLHDSWSELRIEANNADQPGQTFHAEGPGMSSYPPTVCLYGWIGYQWDFYDASVGRWVSTDINNGRQLLLGCLKLES